MAASVHDLRRWFKAGKNEGATHMIVVCDTFEYEDYPVYVMAGEDVHEKEKTFNGENMQRVMEVYNLSMDMEEQMKSETRSCNY